MFFVVNSQILKDYIAIWSHWSQCFKTSKALQFLYRIWQGQLCAVSPDYLIIFQFLAVFINVNLPNGIKIDKISLEVFQIQNKLSKNCQRICQSGKISPNLVALIFAIVSISLKTTFLVEATKSLAKVSLEELISRGPNKIIDDVKFATRGEIMLHKISSHKYARSSHSDGRPPPQPPSCQAKKNFFRTRIVTTQLKRPHCLLSKWLERERKLVQ